MQSDPVVGVRGFPLADYGFRSPPASAPGVRRLVHKAAVGRFRFGAAEQPAQRQLARARAATVTRSSAKRTEHGLQDQTIDEGAAGGGQSSVPAALDRRRRQPEASPASDRVQHQHLQQQQQQRPPSATPARTTAAGAVAVAASAAILRRGKGVPRTNGARGGGARGSLRRARAVAAAAGKPGTIRRGAAVPTRKVKVSTTSSAASKPKAKAKEAGRSGVWARDASADEEAGDGAEEKEALPGRSALSVADAVVTEYEKLLAAIPTMARHMGKLQLDTEAMAEGLEKRVRSLVDGYRELNELVEQAPARMSYAASEYVQAIGLRPQEPSLAADDAGGRDESSQALDVERIHRELFALREAKLALDQVVAPTPAGPQHQPTELGNTSYTRRRGLSKLAATAVESGTGRRYQRSSVSAGAAAVAAGATSRGGRAGDVAAALSAAAATRTRGGGSGTGRSSGRRALAELQVDPDLPLPLPTFPGRGRFLGGDAEQPLSDQAKQTNASQGRRRPAGDPKPPRSGDVDPAEADGNFHGYYVPGVVSPRQRQSHGLPRELRAISTIPTPEKRLPPAAGGAARASGAGQRRRMRSRSTVNATDGVKTRAAPPRPSAPGSSGAATTSQTRGGGGAPSRRPEPGSAAALASAREQRRVTIQAVDELRKEMREREGRLERELDRLRQARSEHAALAGATAAGDSDSAQKAAPPAPANVGGKRRAASKIRGRPRKERPPATKVKKYLVSGRVLGDEKREERDDDEDSPSAPPAVRPVETADAQAQTASDGVQLFLQPRPAVRDAFRAAEDQGRPLSNRVPASVSMASAQQTGRTNVGDGPSTSSSASDGDDSGPGRRFGGWRLSPPPPVVFVEGEGRNVSWRPADDDRLLRPAGASGESEEAIRVGVDAKLVLTADAEGGGGKENEAAGEENASPETRGIQVTNGRLEVAGSESEMLAAGVQDDVWVELAGMLALSASQSPAGQQSNELASTDAPAATAGKAVAPFPEQPAVSPELLNLMREVVGQQKEMGEERSALMQALRAEVDSRRALLANQELSLRERELALERRESESGAAAATARLAAAAATAEAGARKQRQREEADEERSAVEQAEKKQLAARPPPVERFWPPTSDQDVGAVESSSDAEGAGGIALRQGAPAEGAARCEEGGSGKDAPEQLPGHTFRSSLGRLLTAGSGWRDLPLDEVRAPGKHFATSLGRALAGGPAWHQLQLGGEEQLQGHGERGVVSIRGDRTLDPCRRDTARSGGEFNVQELLWEAGRAEAAGDGSPVSSPETAVRRRASALESRRFLAAMAEAEAERHANGGDGGGDDGDCDAESKMEMSATERDQDTSIPPPLLPVPPSASSALQQQQQQQGTGRLHLSLATAVLSVAQRLSTVEERASARAEGAENLARQALEETRREGKEGRERQSQVLHRLKEMEHGSEKRATLVAREIAELREEGRLERQRRLHQVQAQSRRPKVSTPRSPGSRSSSGSGGSGSFLGALSIEAAAPMTPAPTEQQQQRPTPALSDSRSSLSEGQLQGSFSDGELLRLTPRGRHALEDGELPPPPPPPPPGQQGGRYEAEAVGGGSACRNWSRGGDPRQHLTLLMSAHPHLKANRASSARGGRYRAASADTVGRVGGSGVGRRLVAPPRESMSAMDADGGVSRRVLLGATEGAGEEKWPAEDGVYETGGVNRGDGDGSALSDSGCSLEPGQARPPVRRSWQERVSLVSAGGVGVGSGRGGRGEGERFRLGAPWLQHRSAAGSEDTAYSAGETSSGAELGETPPAFVEQDLEDLAAEEERREGGPASRPLKALGLRTGSFETRRRRQTEIQRAVAEAELDLCSATANTLNSSDVAEDFTEGDTKAKGAVVEAEEKIGGGHTNDSSVAATGFEDATEMVSQEGKGDRQE
eukprot:g5391.t1